MSDFSLGIYFSNNSFLNIFAQTREDYLYTLFCLLVKSHNIYAGSSNLELR
jgi:hypothetical protein